MIDLKLLRTNAALVESSFARRRADVDVDRLVKADERHRELIATVESLRAEHNRVNKLIAAASGAEREAAIATARAAAETLHRSESELRAAREELETVAASVPNLVHPDAPESEDKQLREVGEDRTFEFAPADHLTLGENLDIIDMARGAKVSGSRFGFLKGRGALLELALVNFVMSELQPHGFEPLIPPVLVREEAMFGTGFFPTDEAEVYRTAKDDLFLVGTSEVPIASMHAQEILDLADLPLRYAGFSTCFRREAGTYGKDTRGIIRLHQFDKVEMFSICGPESSEDEHEFLLSMQERIFMQLGIRYRVVEIAAAELAAPNYRKFDIEAWLPGAERWLEVTSCSNDIDYQSRRLNIRLRGHSGVNLAHTLNGTGVAVQRAIVALLETHQSAEGGVQIPDPLRRFTGFEAIEPQT